MTYLAQLEEHLREHFGEIEQRMIHNRTSEIPHPGPLPACWECGETPTAVSTHLPFANVLGEDTPTGYAEHTLTPCGHVLVEKVRP